MNRTGITMGDPAGLGPEIILKALSKDDALRKRCIVYGSVVLLKYYSDLLGYDISFHTMQDTEDFVQDKLNVRDVSDFDVSKFTMGVVDPACGEVAYQCIEKAIYDALAHKISAVVTAPINKEALHKAGHLFDGHTEIFAKLTNTKKYSMMLIDKNLRVMHISTHVSLRKACDLVKKKRIIDVVLLANQALLDLKIKNPKIAVAGLNPHSGEGGLFGDEEIKEIIPALNELKEKGINVFGPIPPDVVFLKAAQGHYDMVIAMYHDQGHIPLKLVGFNTGVNVTIGLPIIRTSVDHGTGFDIVGKNIAEEMSLVEAIKIADLLQKDEC